MSRARTTPRLAVIGAGTRGYGYARPATASGAEIVAVAEPDHRRRHRLLRSCGSPTATQASSWDTLELHAGDVDSVIIATMDDMHGDTIVRPRWRHGPAPVLTDATDEKGGAGRPCA